MRTRVGYTGGQKPNPTYHDLGDHTESLQVDYDPAKITYDKLLEVFWASHSPTRKSYSCQYKAAVFTHDEEQAAAARRSRDELAKKLGAPVETEILPLGVFTLAEDYHQKYYLRNARVFEQELRAIYPDLRDFTNSTAATRLNAWLAGDGDKAMLEREIGRLGLSREAQELLRGRVR